MTNYKIPARALVTDGVIDFKKLANLQRGINKEGTDVYKRYEKFWGAVGGNNEKHVVDLKGKREVIGTHTGVTGSSVMVNDDGMRVDGNDSKAPTKQSNHIDQLNSGDDTIWIGLKFDEDVTHYTFTELHGECILREDMDLIKKDAGKYSDFMMMCWSGLIGEEITNTDTLFWEIASLMKLPLDKIRGARVDSDYDEEKGDVVISFKARILRGDV